MKTANLLSIASLLMFAGLASVACSAPPVDGVGDNSSADSKGDDDDDDDDSAPAKKSSSSTKSSSSSTTSPSNTSTTSPTPTLPTSPTTTTPPATGGSCSSCLAANPKAVQFDSCAMNCQDQACADNCMTTSGCGADQACQSTLQQCEATCEAEAGGTDPGTGTGTQPPGGGDDQCLSCLGTSPAAQYIQCSDQCQDEQCDDQCFQQACGANEQACDSKLQQCDAQCGGGQ